MRSAGSRYPVLVVPFHPLLVLGSLMLPLLSCLRRASLQSLGGVRACLPHRRIHGFLLPAYGRSLFRQYLHMMPTLICVPGKTTLTVFAAQLTLRKKLLCIDKPWVAASTHNLRLFALHAAVPANGMMDNLLMEVYLLVALMLSALPVDTNWVLNVRVPLLWIWVMLAVLRETLLTVPRMIVAAKRKSFKLKVRYRLPLYTLLADLAMNLTYLPYLTFRTYGLVMLTCVPLSVNGLLMVLLSLLMTYRTYDVLNSRVRDRVMLTTLDPALMLPLLAGPWPHGRGRHLPLLQRVRDVPLSRTRRCDTSLLVLCVLKWQRLLRPNQMRETHSVVVANLVPLTYWHPISLEIKLTLSFGLLARWMGTLIAVLPTSLMLNDRLILPSRLGLLVQFTVVSTLLTCLLPSYLPILDKELNAVPSRGEQCAPTTAQQPTAAKRALCPGAPSDPGAATLRAAETATCSTSTTLTRRPSSSTASRGAAHDTRNSTPAARLRLFATSCT